MSRDLTTGADDSRFREGIWHTDVCTGVHLQMQLYFGGIFKAVMCVCYTFCGYYKSHWVTEPWVYVFFALGIAHCFFFEPFRYYLGYRGNLNENVPHLFLFVILSLFPGLCTVSVLLIAPVAVKAMQCHRCVLPLEKALVYVDFCFVLAQLGFGAAQLRRLIAKNTTEFYLMQDSNIAGSFKDSPYMNPSLLVGELRNLGKSLEVKLKGK